MATHTEQVVVFKGESVPVSSAELQLKWAPLSQLIEHGGCAQDNALPSRVRSLHW